MDTGSSGFSDLLTALANMVASGSAISVTPGA